MHSDINANALETLNAMQNLSDGVVVSVRVIFSDGTSAVYDIDFQTMRPEYVESSMVNADGTPLPDSRDQVMGGGYSQQTSGGASMDILMSTLRLLGVPVRVAHAGDHVPTYACITIIGQDGSGTVVCKVR
jgi:hypothetical protein